MKPVTDWNIVRQANGIAIQHRMAFLGEYFVERYGTLFSEDDTQKPAARTFTRMWSDSQATAVDWIIPVLGLGL